MAGKKILLLMSGSIATYKACHLISRLVQAGHQVQVVASESALQFVGAATLEGLSGRPVAHSLWEEGRAMDHIHLIREADLVIAAPASAHLINRFAHGIGDDLLTTLFLAHDFQKPFLLAPAMNTKMYLHPATQLSLDMLKKMGVRILETASGVLACGETGYGKLLEPELIFKEIEKELPAPASSPQKAHKKTKVLITAGGTQESLDDVRVLTNTSTGRSGAHFANQLSMLGYDVCLLRARSAVPAESADVRQKTYVTHADLKQALLEELRQNDYSHVIHLAAVSDYQIDRIERNGETLTDARKIPSGGELVLRLKATEKILPLIKETKPVRVAAFKLTSEATAEERKAAMRKLIPVADVVISNDLSEMKGGVHPYALMTANNEWQPLANQEELIAWFSNWISQEAL